MERDKPEPLEIEDLENYYGYQVTRRLNSPQGLPQAPKPDVFGRAPATPRQIEEILKSTRTSRR